MDGYFSTKIEALHRACFPVNFPVNFYFYHKQYGVVVYVHSVKYSHEIPNEYLSGSMAVSLLAYVAIFSDSFVFRKATFSKQILLHNVNFFKKRKILKKPTFSEKQNSALPTFSGELPF